MRRHFPNASTSEPGRPAAPYPTGSRIRERGPLELMKLRAETFAIQLERNRQDFLMTGQSMSLEWAASLERERQSLLAQIQEVESGQIASLDNHSGELDRRCASVVHELVPRPPPRLPVTDVTEARDRGRGLAPYSIHGRGASPHRRATTTLPHHTHRAASYHLTDMPFVSQARDDAFSASPMKSEESDYEHRFLRGRNMESPKEGKENLDGQDQLNLPAARVRRVPEVSAQYPSSPLRIPPHSFQTPSAPLPPARRRRNAGSERVNSPSYMYMPLTNSVGEAGNIGSQVHKVCTCLMALFRDLHKYKKFLTYRDEAAQSLLNLLQMLLDHSQLEERFRHILFVAVVRLARKSELYPQCFTLSNVIRDGEYPVSDGHFGEIYKGRLHDKLVCLKVVKMYLKSDQAVLQKAFSREAVLWGQLSHINVLPFYGVHRLGDTRNRIGLVSPWMEHGNINEYLKRHPGVDRTLFISDVAAGLSYLHKHQVIHGDLKGQNILVNNAGRACLADFGLSSVTDAHGPKTASISSALPEGGTFRFQAPEVLNGCARSRASDVYAFGLVCYEIFTGNHPFPGVRNVCTVMLKVGQGERPARPLEYRDRGLTDHMWRLMEDCWTHAPKNRPNASQILESLPRPTSDPRRGGGWAGLSPPRFGGSNDLSVDEMLRVLETNGISLFQF